MRKLTIIAALLVASPALGAEAVALSVEGLTRSSDAVVRGTVRDMSSALSADGRRVFTFVDVDVEETWRGQDRRTLRVIVPGGEAGGIGQRVDGAPGFTVGEDVVVFLNAAEAGAFRVAGLAQGKFRVDRSQATPDLSRTHMAASLVADGERPAGNMSLAELEQRVRSVP